jgi:hypothetical protein
MASRVAWRGAARPASGPQGYDTGRNGSGTLGTALHRGMGGKDGIGLAFFLGCVVGCEDLI